MANVSFADRHLDWRNRSFARADRLRIAESFMIERNDHGHLDESLTKPPIEVE